jgi:hypothetical protein
VLPPGIGQAEQRERRGPARHPQGWDLPDLDQARGEEPVQG